MTTLLLALLAALLLGRSFEGTVKMPGILASLTFAKFGRVSAALWGFRPGRVYVRLGVA
jgi:hypothetical protein